MLIFSKTSIALSLNVLQIASLSHMRMPLKSFPKMKSTYLITFFFFVFSIAFSQTTDLGGIINQYAKVTSINICESTLTIESPVPFEVGDQVLLIQMKGAKISESNSSSFGDIQEIRSAGLFEKNEIAAINGNVVSLKYLLVNEYDPAGLVQLVSFPVYENAVVTEIISATPWDGDKGGVIALEINNNLDLQASIDASGSGFRGAQTNTVSSDCNFLTNANEYHYSLSNWRGAPKGEGIAAIIAGKDQGRGAQANGGGGGNDHNSGGGGGANCTLAGEGGKTSVGGLGCDGNYPGERGKALPTDSKRLYLGGGGGAGHDNNSSGTNGGNGGGLVFIIANEITSNGYEIIANGNTALTANGDGAGGGGAGGTILIGANTLNDELVIEAIGGNGGNVQNPSDRCIGPGGGGSGGRLVSNLNSNFLMDLSGGLPGVNLNPSGQCSDPSNSADAGSEGLQTSFDGIPASGVEPMPTMVIAQPQDVLICEGDLATFEFQMQGQFLDYQWQVDDGSGWQNIPTGTNYSGDTTAVLEISNPVIAMFGYQYRCFVTGPCSADEVSLAAELTVESTPSPSFSFDPLGNGEFQFNNTSSNATSYLWDFDDGTTSDKTDPAHTFSGGGFYSVTLTAFNDCGETAVTQIINAQTTPTANFSSDVETGCAPLVVQFFNNSSANSDSFEWHFAGGTPATSTDENPFVAYPMPSIYEVTLIAFNQQGSDTITVSSAVLVGGPPVADFNTSINLLDVNFINTSLGATDGFIWDFGDGNTSMQVNPIHSYQSGGQYTVTLTASNDCGETVISQTISIGGFPFANFSANFNNPCAPVTVQFQNQSTGENIISYLWEFEGGTPTVSNAPNPTVTYTLPGIYDVKLTATNSLGEHTTLMEDYVEILATPIANFDFTILTDTVQFINLSTGGSFWYWDFGDGNNSSESDPQHIYAHGGVFLVTLTTGNSACGSAISQEVFIDLPNATKVQSVFPSILLYPNPIFEKLNLVLGEMPSDDTELSMIGLDGRTLMKMPLFEKNISLDVGKMATGLYFIQLKNGERTVVLKLLKQ